MEIQPQISRSPRIFIVEDQIMVADLLRRWCEEDLSLPVAGMAMTGRAAIEQIVSVRPDIVLLDIGLPDINGYQVLVDLRARLKSLRAIVITGYCTLWSAYRAEGEAVSGLIYKGFGGIADLRKAISEALAGRRFLAQPFQKLLHANRLNPNSFDKVLSRWQISLLAYIGASWSNDEIAHELEVTAESIAKQRSLIKAALQLTSARALVHFARENGFADGVGQPRRQQ